MNNKERLVRIVGELMESEEDIKLDANTNLIEDLGFDSVNIINLVILIEEEFDIEFEDFELGLETLASFSKLLEIVNKKEMQ